MPNVYALRYLGPQRSQFETIEQEAIAKIRSRIRSKDQEHLDLSDLGLRMLPNDFFDRECPCLRTLDISGNNVQEIPNGLERLEELIWKNSNLLEIPCSISHLQALRKLDLSCNSIQQLHSEPIIALSRLEELNLEGHSIYMGRAKPAQAYVDIVFHPTLKTFWFSHYSVGQRSWPYTISDAGQLRGELGSEEQALNRLGFSS